MTTPRPLRKGDPITLLPSGELTTVRVAGKNSFAVAGHVTALLLSDEWHPTDNPAGKWARPETKARFTP
jgi:hypothetical protein